VGAVGMPDIFQLLSHTRKTGALHLRRDGQHGVVHLRDGAITSARSDHGRQELARRLVGSGLVDDEALAAAAEQVAESDDDGAGDGLATLLVQRAGLDPAAVTSLAGEQATDAVFDLLRWPDGEFAFLLGEQAADDLGAALTVDEVVAESHRRLELWGSLVDSVPTAAAVLRLHPAPPGDPTLSRDEWALISLVDGHRSVADLVGLAGRGEYAVVSTLAGLIARGLLVSSGPADAQLQRRQALLAALEGRAVPEPSVPVQPAPAVAPTAAATEGPAPVIPQRREPFVPLRRPEHADASPARAVVGAGAVAASVGAVDGSSALQPQSAPVASPYVSLDANVNKTLLLRLIAGVRGL
jgi:hypothetical protein